MTNIELINKGESSTTEFKSTLRIDLKSNKPEKYIEHAVLKTIVAFLNTSGGNLFIGIDDKKNVLGLDSDFNSFKQSDKKDEFQKHLDNLIGIIGSRFYRYLNIDFLEIKDKTICIISVSGKSSEPVFITDNKGEKKFYIRRFVSTVDLKLSEALKYIQEHWSINELKREQALIPYNFFNNEREFKKEIISLLSNKDSEYYLEIKEHWNTYSLISDSELLNKILNEFLPKSIDYGLLPLISDFVSNHLYNDGETKYIYNQPHIYMHNGEEEGYNLPVYYHIRFIGILYATAIHNKVDIDTVSVHRKSMNSIFSTMIEGMINNLIVNEENNNKEYPSNYHWLIGEIFGITSNWIDTFNDDENFDKRLSYLDFIPFNIRLSLAELYKGLFKEKLTLKFVTSQIYYGVLTHYFSPLLKDEFRDSIEENIISQIPVDIVEPILRFALDEKFASNYEMFCKGEFRGVNNKEKIIQGRLRTFLLNNKMI